MIDAHTGAAPCGVLAALETGEEFVVRVAGEVDLTLRSALLAMAEHVAGYHGRTIVDLSDVTFADATLVALLVRLPRTPPVTVRAPNRQVCDLLRLCGLDQALHIVG